MSRPSRQINIISYEGSSYKTDFWEGQGREFEDRTERRALRRLLPVSGRMLIELGAGFGRLADLYQGFEQVILVDYSTSLLREAQQRLGADPRYRFVAANVYHLPFVDNLADTVVMIRVAHHLEAVDEALSEIHRIVRGRGVFIMEFANKRNAKAIARYLVRRQHWSPFAPEPYEFVPLNFDFHPDWMRQRIQEAGFSVQEELAISNFRLPAIKRHVSPDLLARLDNVIARPGAALKISPSILTKNIAVHKSEQAPAGLFQCPQCQSRALDCSVEACVCVSCGARWPVLDGIIDFRYPRPE